MINFLKNKKEEKSGFTLIEVLVALLIFSLSILAIMAVLGNGISDIGKIKKKIVAEYLAQEGIEYIRNIRDTEVLEDPFNNISGLGWDKFYTELITKCSISCYINNTIFPSNINNISQIFQGNPTPELHFVASSGKYNYDMTNGISSGFTRVIYVETVSNTSDEIKIYSEVYWGNNSIIFSENLYNWVE